MQATDIIIVLNLIILESLLSIDNAAVLAVMVKDLPGKQKGKALKYGILGAFVFRGICLVFASLLIKILWLKIIGGLYLLYLVYKYFRSKNDTQEEIKIKRKPRFINEFWSTVLLVEIMDLAFSIDNIFAAVAMTSNLYLIMFGVFIGIIAMRYVAQVFVKLMEKFPSLSNSAFYVIALLGVRLVFMGVLDYIPGQVELKTLLNGHSTDMIFSVVMIVIFLLPIIKKLVTRR